MIKFIKNLLHFHHYNKLIVSQYWTFQTRRVIRECRCGNRIQEFTTFDSIYPFPTSTMLTDKEFKEILNNK